MQVWRELDPSAQVVYRTDTPTFEAILQDGQLLLLFPNGGRRQFERSDVEALTRFLDQYAQVQPLPAPDDSFLKPSVLSETEVKEAIHALLEQLPKSYPPFIFSRNEKGYWLEIERTIIFRGASGEDAIKHTTHYVQARKDSPSLPIGVIYGIYD